MKRIIINCRILNKRHGGPKRFLMNLLKGLAKKDSINEYVLVLDKQLSFNLELPSNFSFIVLDTKSRFIYEYISLPLFTNKYKPDIFIVTDPCYSPLIKAKKITVYHDIIYFEKDQKREFNFFDNLHHRIMIPICGKMSNLNVCVSKFTQSRVVELLGLKNTKVLYEDVDDVFSSSEFNEGAQQMILNKYGIKKPYLFYVGSLSPRKNVERIIDAFLLIKNHLPINLYLVGGYSWNDSIIRKTLLKNNQDDRIKKIGFIDEVDLPVIYNQADMFVYPSLYEGFGLPILESQSSGCALITSNTGAMKEIAGEGALLIDPYSERDIASAISELYLNSELKDHLIKSGKENLKRFSWTAFTEEFIKTYDTL